MKILVTGATGFIGFHIVEELAKQGLALRAAHRPGDQFQGIASDFLIDGLDLESLALDITDRRAVFQALNGCTMLFHADYFVSFDSKDKSRLYAVNQMGTKNLMEAALHHGVDKVIYTSGMETLKASPGREAASEADGVALEDLSTHFEKSRYLAEREVAQVKQKGLNIILTHPTVCLGRGERGLTPFGRYLRRFLKGRVHFYLDTGLNLVDVVDVAKGHLLAAKRGEPGHRYILGNQNVYMLDILRHLEKFTGIPAPKTALPLPIAKWGNLLARNLLRRMDGSPNALLAKLKAPLFFNVNLAKMELGMPQSNVWEALKRQLIDIQKTGR